MSSKVTAAVLGMEEIRDMVNEMFAANKDYFGHFKTLRVPR